MGEQSFFYRNRKSIRRRSSGFVRINSISLNSPRMMVLEMPASNAKRMAVKRKPTMSTIYSWVT